MSNQWFVYDDELDLNQQQFEKMFQQVMNQNPSLKQVMTKVKAVFLLSDWPSFSMIKPTLFSLGMKEENIDLDIRTYESDHWRGVCYVYHGVIVLNLFEIIRGSFSLPQAKNNDDYHFLRQICFWETLFHEIRHVEQFNFPLSYTDEEEDADQYGREMYTHYIEPMNERLIVALN